jgi:hypothetical protein
MRRAALAEGEMKHRLESICAALLMAVLVYGMRSDTAYAETMYTTLQDTIVYDKPVADASAIIAHLPSGSMIETVKEVGAFTTISFIQNGKVGTGLVATAQLNGEVPAQTNGGSTSAETATTNAVPNAPVVAPAAGPAAGPVDSPSVQVSKLEAIRISPGDLAVFAKRGKLVERKAKGKSAR